MTEVPQKILLVRTDKIGDLVLSTPALLALKEKFPTAQIDFLIHERNRELLEGHPTLHRCLLWDPDRDGGFWGSLRLGWSLRKERYDAVVAFQTRFGIAMALLLAGISVRVGPLSQWWSWLAWNRGRRQNRSAVEMHEAEYNIHLLRHFGISVASTRQPTRIVVQPERLAEGKKFLEAKALRSQYKTVLIHPGMAGSALNWPEQNYIELGQKLLRKYNIIVSGGPGEELLLDRIIQGIAQEQNFYGDQPVLCKYAGTQGLGHFLGILAACDAVVAPSTGPLHLAVALEKKVVSVYSPIRVQSALRWGPYGVNFGTTLGLSPGDRASVLVPDVNCAEDFHCAGSACIYYPCMPRISVDTVETQLDALLSGVGVSMVKGTSFSATGNFSSSLVEQR